jgi:hypothetical protein
MRELKIIEKIICWFKSLLINEEEAKEISDEIKREMCKRALQSNVCPHDCDRCAWNTLR